MKKLIILFAFLGTLTACHSSKPDDFDALQKQFDFHQNKADSLSAIVERRIFNRSKKFAYDSAGTRKLLDSIQFHCDKMHDLNTLLKKSVSEIR